MSLGSDLREIENKRAASSARIRKAIGEIEAAWMRADSVDRGVMTDREIALVDELQDFIRKHK